MNFQVSQEDILKGERCRSFNCPVALCIYRTLELFKYNKVVSVIPITGEVEIVDVSPKMDTVLIYRLPDNAKTAAMKFDHMGIMLPFEFTLPVIDRDLELIKKGSEDV